MKIKVFLLLIFVLGIWLLPAQFIRNVRVEMEPECGYYIITYDLDGNQNESYQIQIIPYLEDKELLKPLSLFGDGVNAKIKSGNKLMVFWDPILEGLSPGNWQFRILVNAPSVSNMAFVSEGNLRKQVNYDPRTRTLSMYYSADTIRQNLNWRISSFWISKNEVTQYEWVKLMGENPSRFVGANLPVDSVSWYDALEYCNRLSKKEGLIPCYSITAARIDCDWYANGYRLPTEAEWEYAASGGNQSKGFKYSGSNKVGEVAWYKKNSGKQTHEVKTKLPNELGIYDMSGNVLEWCWDWYSEEYYVKTQGVDPKGTGRGLKKVVRGGKYNWKEMMSQVVFRMGYTPYENVDQVGFRVVRSVR